MSGLKMTSSGGSGTGLQHKYISCGCFKATFCGLPSSLFPAVMLESSSHAPGLCNNGEPLVWCVLIRIM